MVSELERRRLWVALSYLFVDTEIDFEQLMSVAKDYSVDEVEFALFERVAPVCISNMLSPAPSIWWHFDEEKLVAEIEMLIEVRSRYGIVDWCMSVMKGWFIRFYCFEVWGEVKVEMKKIHERL